MASAVFTKDDWPLPPGTHLAVEAPHTGLSHDAVELWLLGILATDVTDLGFSVIRDETRLFRGDRAAALCM